jgi:hypothetical protein
LFCFASAFPANKQHAFVHVFHTTSEANKVVPPQNLQQSSRTERIPINDQPESYVAATYQTRTKYRRNIAAFLEFTRCFPIFEARYVRFQYGIGTREKSHVFAVRPMHTHQDFAWGRGRCRDEAIDAAIRATFHLLQIPLCAAFPMDDDCLLSRPERFMPPPPTIPPTPTNLRNHLLLPLTFPGGSGTYMTSTVAVLFCYCIVVFFTRLLYSLLCLNKVTSDENHTSQQSNVAHVKAGAWTPEEESLFLKGLDQYGREWKDISLFMKTRSSGEVTLHAHAYFQDLAVARLNGQRLPVEDARRLANHKAHTKAATATGSDLNSGPWTADELCLYHEGLQRHGRDWEKIAVTIKTRSNLQIREKVWRNFHVRGKHRDAHRQTIANAANVAAGVQMNLPNRFCTATANYAIGAHTYAMPQRKRKHTEDDNANIRPEAPSSLYQAAVALVPNQRSSPRASGYLTASLAQALEAEPIPPQPQDPPVPPTHKESPQQTGCVPSPANTDSHATTRSSSNKIRTQQYYEDLSASITAEIVQCGGILLFDPAPSTIDESVEEGEHVELCMEEKQAISRRHKDLARANILWSF